MAVSVEHPLRDAYWEGRNTLPLMRGLEIPVYLGCDWENVPLHLPSTFALWRELEGSAPLRMGMLGKGGLTWPWESLHIEALAWFDHWLKDADTGIMDGPPVRYWLPGAEEFREALTWPPPESHHIALALRFRRRARRRRGRAGRARLRLPTGEPEPPEGRARSRAAAVADLGDRAAGRPRRRRRRARAGPRREHVGVRHSLDRDAPGRRPRRRRRGRDRGLAAREHARPSTSTRAVRARRC